MYAELLAEAGLPEGLFHVLPGGPDFGQALVRHPGVGCIWFTGSTPAGREVGAAATSLMKAVHLELGGNNALLVLPDADLEAAASAGAWGSFLHQGQICMTTGRHLVDSSMVGAVHRGARAQGRPHPGRGCQRPGQRPGPAYRRRPTRQGAPPRNRDRRPGCPARRGGHLRRAVLPAHRPCRGADRRPSLRRGNLYGPVAPVTTYRNVEEAIDLINASDFGLSVSILTSDAYAAFELSRGDQGRRDPHQRPDRRRRGGGPILAGSRPPAAAAGSAGRPTSTPSPTCSG